MTELHLDVSGQSCPMPVVRAKLALDDLQSGDVLRLTSTDRGSLSDVPAWASAVGHTLRRVVTDGDRFEFEIEKS